jgi:hypothetical protein
LRFYIFIQDFKLARDLLNAVEKEACSSSINSGVLFKLIRLLSWETLLIQIIEFLTEWPNHKLSKYIMMIYDHDLSISSKAYSSCLETWVLFLQRFMSEFVELTLPVFD